MEKELKELFPTIQSIDQLVFNTGTSEEIHRTDVYGAVCQMINQYPGYALRIVRRVIREKKKNDKSWAKNLDSLIVNMSRYLFEPPHSEETNYYSTTYRMDEKSFLLFLSMFIVNVDLINEGGNKEEKEEIVKASSGDYQVT